MFFSGVDVPKSADTTSTVDSWTKPEEQSTDNASKEDSKEEVTSNDKDKEEEAATRIQAAFRGHNVRKNLKGEAPESSVKNEEEQTRTEEPLSIKDKIKKEVEDEVKGNSIFFLYLYIIQRILPNRLFQKQVLYYTLYNNKLTNIVDNFENFFILS